MGPNPRNEQDPVKDGDRSNDNSVPRYNMVFSRVSGPLPFLSNKGRGRTDSPRGSSDSGPSLIVDFYVSEAVRDTKRRVYNGVDYDKKSRMSSPLTPSVGSDDNCYPVETSLIF